MATISQKEWKQYIAQLRKINDKAVEEFETWVIKNMGYAHIERQKLIDYAYGIATKYGEASAALSSSMYDTIANMSGVSVPAALPAETASYQDVCKTVNGIIKKTGNTKILAQGIGRLVKMAGTDTILSNAYRDRARGKGSKKRHSGAKVAWIPSGDTCPFCLMLASKGWQNQTVWGANNHSEHIHANCDCTYAVKFNDSVDYAGYDPDEYKAIYDNAEGKTRDEKFRSMQRQYRAENRDRINAQKRANYAEKKIQEEIDKIENTPFRIREGVGAMVKRFYVETEKPIKDFEDLFIKANTYVEGVKVIATGDKIRDVERLINEYKLPNGDLTKTKDWFKVRGRAMLTDGTKDLGTREVHWYQAKNIGKVEFKFPSNERQR